MTQATTSLPPLDADYALTEEQIASFQKNGHIMLPGVCSPEEIAVYRPILNVATDRFKTENRPMEERDTYGKAFLQIMNLWVRDAEVRQFTLARRFAKIAADLMKAEGDYDKLVGSIQQRYGYTRERVDRELNAFFDSHKA